MYDLIIIGAGASGLVSAITAIKNNQKILLIEKMNQCGRKLRITGKGRCNLSNTLPLKEFLNHCGPEPRFLYPAFNKFFSKDLISLMEELGVETKIERGNRVFPKSDKAQDVFLGLINRIENSNASILKNSRVAEILLENNSVKGIKLSSGKEYYAKKVILACGGESYPVTGSEGDGIKLAKGIGHDIIPTIPCLVGLKLNYSFPDNIQDFSLRNVRAKVLNSNQKILFEEFGEMNFTSDGVYGPIILSLNRRVARRLYNNEKLTLSIDLKPAIDEAIMNENLIRELDNRGGEDISSCLRGFLPRNMIDLALKETNISPYKKSSFINSQERKSILKFLKDLRFEIIGDYGFDQAIITMGGVNLKEINPKTMESKLVRGLFFAGEVIDIDGDTGGFNLQIAFSTGHLAALNQDLE